jgi:hypothetical protein
MSRTKRPSIDRNRPVHAFRLGADHLYDLPFDDDPVPTDRCFEDDARVVLEGVGDARRAAVRGRAPLPVREEVLVKRIRNRTVNVGRDQQLIDGIRKDLLGFTELHLAGETFTPATLEARFQARIEAADLILAAKAAWHQAITAYAGLEKQTNVIVHDLENVVVAAFGAESPQLADFGFTPRKVVTLTEAQKALAVTRRAATRKARGTVGPKARLLITS